MSDDARDDTPEPEAETPSLLERRDCAQREPVTAAVQTSELWGGPRFVENIAPEPIWVETKEQYFALLNQHGIRMKHQQESRTGPESLPAPVATPLHLLPPPPVPPMRQEEAHIYGAMTAVLRRYALVETIWCHHCFARNLQHGCKMIVASRGVHLECRCGIARYEAPVGATDLVLNRIAHEPVRERDTRSGTVMVAPGTSESRPTTILLDTEAKIVRAYFQAMNRRGKEPRLFHRGCFKQRVSDESNALAIDINRTDIVMLCDCRTLFHRRGTPQPQPTATIQ
jgi:hypothetical protein